MAVVAAGCAAPADDGAPRLDGWHPRGGTWPRVAAGGFDPLDHDAVWSAGDFVRYRIEATTGDALRTWTLEVSLPDVPEPLAEPLFADTASGFLRLRNARSQELTDRATGRRLLRYVRSQVVLRLWLTRDDTAESFTTDVPTQVQAHVWQETVDTRPEVGIDFLFPALMKVRRLLDELLDVVRPPSVWSVIGNGMRVSVRLELHGDAISPVTEVDTPLGRVPAFWLPATLYANEQRALDCRFLITWRRSPLLPSLGVLRIEGRHPDDDRKRVVAAVIAARRGRPAVLPDRDDLGVGLRKGMTEAGFVAALGAKRDRVYRVPGPAGQLVDLVCVECPEPLGRLVGAFASGRLLYCNHPGKVSTFLRSRGFESGP